MRSLALALALLLAGCSGPPAAVVSVVVAPESWFWGVEQHYTYLCSAGVVPARVLVIIDESSALPVDPMISVALAACRESGAY